MSHYIKEGLERGEGVLAITSPAHRQAIEQELLVRRFDTRQALEKRHLMFVDARSLLSLLVSGGNLEWSQFDRIIGAIISQVASPSTELPLRAFADMVGLLWGDGEYAKAAMLEQFWDRLLLSRDLQLYCAYPIDVFGAEFQTPAVREILRRHTGLASFCNHAFFGEDIQGKHDQNENGQSEDDQSEDDQRDDAAVIPTVGAALELRGLRASGQRNRNTSGMQSPQEGTGGAGAGSVWICENLPSQADEIMTRTRQDHGSEKHFRALIENSSDAIALTDRDGQVLYASRSSSRVLGYQPSEITGRKAISFIHPADRQSGREAMRTILYTPRVPVTIEARVRDRNGQWRWIEATGANFLDDPEIAALVFNYRDITDRKASETVLRQRESALMRANTALEQLGFATAHDLQEPIRNAAIFAELLSRRYSEQLDAEGREFLGIVLEGAQRTQTLTRDLLAFTQSLDGDYLDNDEKDFRVTQTDANSVMAEVAARLANVIEENRAEVTWDALPELRVRRPHLFQVLLNLVGNGLKYRSDAAPRVRVSASPASDEWLISVADNGMGIPAQYREHIFGVFKRLHGRDIPGNGIGLAICSRIVTHYGGTIRVEPRPGGGSILIFSLPRENGHGKFRSQAGY